MNAQEYAFKSKVSWKEVNNYITVRLLQCGLKFLNVAMQFYII